MSTPRPKRRGRKHHCPKCGRTEIERKGKLWHCSLCYHVWKVRAARGGWFPIHHKGYREPTIDGMVKAIHALSVKKGWWTECPETFARHAFMMSEIAEATDSVRKGEPHTWFQKNGKPEGERIELADCVMRIMDHFGQRGWSLEDALNVKMQYNETRPARVKGKVVRRA